MTHSLISKRFNLQASISVILSTLPRILPMILTVVLFYVLLREMNGFDFKSVINGFSKFSIPMLICIAVLAAISYCMGGIYDVLATRHLKIDVSTKRAIAVGTVATIFAINIGFSLLSGTAIRYRFYSQKGVELTTIAKIVFFNMLTFWIGIILILSFVMVFYAASFSQFVPFAISVLAVRSIGILLLLVFCLYCYCGITGKNIQIKSFLLAMPSFKIIFYQAVTSVIDWLIIFLIFYVILAAPLAIGFTDLLTSFMLAQLAGFASNIPAGLGAFDGTILYMLSQAYTSPEILMSALLIYRLVAYLIPFIFGTLAFGVYELSRHRQRLAAAKTIAFRVNQALIPRFAAVVIFITGLLLLASGHIPTSDKYLYWAATLIPHSLIELSHFMASIVGVALLLFARGLLYRSQTSYFMTVALLVLGIIFCFSKGIHTTTAIILLMVLLVFIPTKPFFYRKQASFKTLFSIQWLLILLFLSFSLFWFIRLGHQYSDYSMHSWLKFELLNDVPRTIRAMLGGAILLSSLLLIRLIYSPARPASMEHNKDLDLANSILMESDNPEGYLALLGDKDLMFNSDKTAYIMYGIQGRSWIAMGDPIGDSSSWDSLVWEYCRAADKCGAWPVFYQVAPQNLPVYLDLGFSIHKIGEEARVFLPEFSIEGRARSNLRQSVNKMQRLNASFEVLPPESVPAILDELEAVSDAWLINKKTREKGFSLGFFDKNYLLSNQPMAIVRIDGKLVAFANIWRTNKYKEITHDMMRFTHEAPNGIMDYLFTQLMLWSKEQGYEWFSLGMVPLSGIHSGLRTAKWNEFVNLIYHHGEHFYNFEGLRRYKKKYTPVWESRYLVSPGGFRTTFVLRDISSIISGGGLGVFKR